MVVKSDHKTQKAWTSSQSEKMLIDLPSCLKVGFPGAQRLKHLPGMWETPV